MDRQTLAARINHHRLEAMSALRPGQITK